MQRIPVESRINRNPFLDRLDQQLEILQRRVGKYAVAEVVDVAGAPAGPSQHVPGPLADQLGRAEQDGRVEVALDAALAEPGPAGVEADSPIERDDVRPRVCDVLEQPGRPGSEVDPGDAQALGRG